MRLQFELDEPGLVLVVGAGLGSPSEGVLGGTEAGSEPLGMHMAWLLRLHVLI